RSLREEVAANFDLPSDRTTNDPTTDEPGAMWRSKMEAVRRSIDIGLNSLDGETFDRVVELLRDDSRPLCLVAAATGHALLDYFRLLVRYYRRDVILLDSTDRMVHQLIDLPDNAILLASVFDRHSRMVESVLRLFHQRNMTTVLLTNRSSTPMRRYADHVLLVSSESSTAFRSRACYLILLESLVAALAPADYEVERFRVETMQGLFDELGVFITP
ncbi:RpiR family transcriptional regulator, partial [Cutibacterium acnes]